MQDSIPTANVLATTVNNQFRNKFQENNMLNKAKLLFVAFALSMMTFQSAHAQWVLESPMPNGGKSIEVVLDSDRENGLIVSVQYDHILISINHEYHKVSINSGIKNRLRIVDGDYDSAILVVGQTPAASLELYIWGQGGDDWIHNQIGHVYGLPASVIDAGSGDDQVWSGPGFDTVYGGEGNDMIVGGTGPDHLEGGNGNDRLLGQDGDDFLLGGNGLDEVDGGAGNDVLFGNELLPDYDGKIDLLIGGTGNDLFYSAFYRWQGPGIFKAKVYYDVEIMGDYSPYFDSKIETELPERRYGRK